MHPAERAAQAVYNQLYYVSYTFKLNGVSDFGGETIITDGYITTHEGIQSMIDKIRNDHGYNEVTIISFFNYGVQEVTE